MCVCVCIQKRVKYLLEQRGASVNQPNKDRQTPLYIAADHHRLHIIRLLATHKPDLNHHDRWRRTALYIASERGHVDAVHLLAELKVDCNKASDSGFTPLHVAAYEGHTDVVKYLVERCGVKIETQNWLKISPINEAYNRGHPELEKYLKEQVNIREQRATVAQANPAPIPPKQPQVCVCVCMCVYNNVFHMDSVLNMSVTVCCVFCVCGYVRVFLLTIPLLSRKYISLSPPISSALLSALDAFPIIIVVSYLLWSHLVSFCSICSGSVTSAAG